MINTKMDKSEILKRIYNCYIGNTGEFIGLCTVAKYLALKAGSLYPKDLEWFYNYIMDTTSPHYDSAGRVCNTSPCFAFPMFNEQARIEWLEEHINIQYNLERKL